MESARKQNLSRHLQISRIQNYRIVNLSFVIIEIYLVGTYFCYYKTYSKKNLYFLGHAWNMLLPDVLITLWQEMCLMHNEAFLFFRILVRQYLNDCVLRRQIWQVGRLRYLDLKLIDYFDDYL